MDWIFVTPEMIKGLNIRSVGHFDNRERFPIVWLAITLDPLTSYVALYYNVKLKVVHPVTEY